MAGWIPVLIGRDKDPSRWKKAYMPAKEALE